MYLYDLENVSDTFSKIEFGLDCSEFYNGKIIKDILGIQIIEGFNEKI